MSAERLQKALARAGIASRRAAEELIRQGRVRVEGRVVTELGTKVEEGAEITVDGRPIPRPPSPIYLMLHKPPGYVTTVHDPHGRTTVLDIVRRAGWAGQGNRLYPVGRLDKESEGLLLITNDGELTLRLTHPRYHLEREYLVMVRGQPTEEALNRLRRGGIVLDGRPTAPARVEPAHPPPGAVSCEDTTWLRFVLREGRKRQVRRMCEMVGHPVLRLIRIRIGPLRLGRLPPGAVRPLTPEEVRALKMNYNIAGGKP